MLEKLMKIQQTLKAPKGQFNSFGGYNYRSCEDILEAVKPTLKELYLILVLNDELVYLGERYYIKATACLKDIETGEEITNTAYAREEETKKGMDGSQITGASSSYARKYALNGLFLIDDVKDSDSTNKGEITLEMAQNYVFETGKHKGEKLIDLITEEDSYIDWIMSDSKMDDVKEMITLLTGQASLSKESKEGTLKLYTELDKLLNEHNLDRDEIYKANGVKTMKELNNLQLLVLINDIKEGKYDEN